MGEITHKPSDVHNIKLVVYTLYNTMWDEPGFALRTTVPVIER